MPYKFKELFEQVNDSTSQFLAQSLGDEIFDFMLSNRSQSERTAMHSWLENFGLLTQVREVWLIFGHLSLSLSLSLPSPHSLPSPSVQVLPYIVFFLTTL